MTKVILSENEVLEYVEDNIINSRFTGKVTENAKYHHNTDYKDAASICRHGILTFEDLNKYGVRNDSNNILDIMSDTESHVNGNNSVSLSIVGLNDLYPDEYEYDPFSPNLVDFLVTSDLRASRISIHYGNEFLSYRSINKSELASLDIRLLQYIKLRKKHLKYTSIKSVLQKYNHLIDISREIGKQNLNIPLREMSEDTIFEIDSMKMANQSKLILKK